MMDQRKFLVINPTGATAVAARELERMGQVVTEAPSPSVTHWLLPVPSFNEDGSLRGSVNFNEITTILAETVTIIGGGLRNLDRNHCWDLLQDESYLAKNAAITAYCALPMIMNALPVVMEGCPVLMIGWGRIGKMLAKLLHQLGADVTVASRSPENRAILAALGYGAEDPTEMSYILGRYRLIINTAPAVTLSEAQLAHRREDCVLIDLASVPGLPCSGVISARGLPGKYAPESSGKLIARTILGFCAQKEGRI